MPNIDIKAILQSEIDALKQISVSHLPEITGAVSQYLILNTERLEALASGDFDTEYIEQRLSEEGDIIKGQLSSFEVFGQMIAKDAQDQTLTTIITTILSVIAQFIASSK